MVLFNTDNVPRDAIARPVDLEVVYGKQEVVPEFVDDLTQSLGGKAMLEDNDVDKSIIVMVSHLQEVKAKEMVCYRRNGPDNTGALVPSQTRQQRAGLGTNAYVVMSRGIGSCLI